MGQSNDDVDGHKIISMAHGQGGAEIGFDRGPTLTCNHEAPIAAYPATAHTLRGEGFDASEDGTGRGTPLVPVAFSCKDYGADAGEVAPTLRSMGHDKSHANAGGQVAIAFNARQDPDHWHDRTGPLDTDGGTQAVSYAIPMQVRRLTPTECARLQGFADDYLDITYRGKPAADGPKYKALGNSWAVPCVTWIGQRIAASIE